MPYIEDDPAYKASREVRRRKVLSGLKLTGSLGVEIGALCRPFVCRNDGAVLYVDHADTATLKQKYKNDPQVDISKIVDVDGVWGENTLQDAVQGKYVDYVIASHVIEHVPDLITWLKELASILKSTGEVRLIVPDKRLTFDYFRQESRLSDVMLSYITQARAPQPHSLLDFALGAAKVDGSAAWRGPLSPEAVDRHYSWQEAIGLARDVMQNGTYHDVHCWVFTPQSFARLMGEITATGMVDFACEGFQDTADAYGEFFVSMRRSSDPEYVRATWAAMECRANTVRPGSTRWKVLRAFCLPKDGKTLHPRTRPSGEPSDLDPTEPLSVPQGFNEKQYLSDNPDVRAAGIDPTTHFRFHGWREGRPIHISR